HVPSPPLVAGPIEAADALGVPQGQIESLLQSQRMCLDTIVGKGESDAGACLSGAAAMLRGTESEHTRQRLERAQIGVSLRKRHAKRQIHHKRSYLLGA